jgi:hypothetical protein
MRKRVTDPHKAGCHDKQLQNTVLEAVLEKRRLDQALNVKEFAVCAGISYSTARSWFRLPGFPAFQGVVFWQDFVNWRTSQNSHAKAAPESHHEAGRPSLRPSDLPARAAQILAEAIGGDSTATH